jgi:MFS family permease
MLWSVAAVQAVLGVVGNNAWTTWMAELVPSSLRGRYFGRRAALATLSGGAAALGAGLLLDRAKRLGLQGQALSGLAALAVIAGLLTARLLKRQREAPIRTEPEVATARLSKRDCVPLLAYALVFNAATGLSAGALAVYMLKDLRMSFALMAAHAAAAGLVRVLATPAWGRALDRLGAKPVLVACSLGLVIAPLVWLGPTPSSLMWALGIDVLLAGSLWGGHALATLELPMSMAPRDKRPYLLAAFAAAGGGAFALAAVLGGKLWQGVGWIWVLDRPLPTVHFMLLLTAAGRMAAFPLALSIIEPGRRRPREPEASMGKEEPLPREALAKRSDPLPAGSSSSHAPEDRPAPAPGLVDEPAALRVDGEGEARAFEHGDVDLAVAHGAGNRATQEPRGPVGFALVARDGPNQAMAEPVSLHLHGDRRDELDP